MPLEEEEAAPIAGEGHEEDAPLERKKGKVCKT